jgi:lipoprotein-anchoring transpeptidase ErfK/SrfK
MLFRSLFLLGLSAALGIATPAVAQTATPQKPILIAANTKASAEAKPAVKGQKKKVAAKATKKKAVAVSGLTAAEKAKAREAALEKARQAKLLALRAKAKADADARRAAALAPREAKPVAVAKANTAGTVKRRVQPAELVSTGGTVRQGVPVSGGRIMPVTGLTADRIAAQRAASVGADLVVRKGNNGELRSADAGNRNSGFFQVLFGDEPASPRMLPETQALDAALEQRQQVKGKFKLKPQYEAQTVSFSGYPRGTIVIDTDAHFLYLVESPGTARRYGIAVGRDGLQFKGKVAVGDKQEWPRWIPTKEMQQREPHKYGQYKDGMPGGGQNPLGARAMYLYTGKQDTHLRIHGTIVPQSIGTNSSNGCFRMTNEHVIDLYSRVRTGTPVIIL